jgi:hypothetical protein
MWDSANLLRRQTALLLLYQGSTSVVPQRLQNKLGLSPCTRSACRVSGTTVEATGFSPWNHASAEEPGFSPGAP